MACTLWAAFAVQNCSRQFCQDPAKLERLIKMIEKEQWSTLPADVKGDIYEGLLERNAQDVKGGADHPVDTH